MSLVVFIERVSLSEEGLRAPARLAFGQEWSFYFWTNGVTSLLLVKRRHIFTFGKKASHPYFWTRGVTSLFVVSVSTVVNAVAPIFSSDAVSVWTLEIRLVVHWTVTDSVRNWICLTGNLKMIFLEYSAVFYHPFPQSSYGVIQHVAVFFCPLPHTDTQNLFQRLCIYPVRSRDKHIGNQNLRPFWFRNNFCSTEKHTP